MTSQKWLVAWDFPKRPVSTFYDIYVDEFGPEVKRVQRSVVICKGQRPSCLRDGWSE